MSKTLWEIQGSYWRAEESLSKGGFHQNRRTFVVTDTAEHAMSLWHASCAGPDSVIHQVLRRSSPLMDLIVDVGPEG